MRTTLEPRVEVSLSFAEKLCHRDAKKVSEVLCLHKIEVSKCFRNKGKLLFFTREQSEFLNDVQETRCISQSQLVTI